jgi:DNA-binding CsgD family transcriptional regulator
MWSEEVLPGGALRRPHSDWDVEVMLDLLASLSAGPGGERCRVLAVVLVGLHRPADCDIDTDALAWVTTCVWVPSSGMDLLREGSRSLVARRTLLASIHSAAGDDRSHESRVVAVQTPRADGLTPRQHDILAGMAEGLTNRQIAARICFSESTVRLESMTIYRFFGVHSRAEAVAAARREGMLLDGHLSLGA